MATKYGFAKGLKELRFLFCQTSEHSAATRNFLTKSYPTMKKHNPHTPIMIREASGIEPKVYARYAYVQKKTKPVTMEAALYESDKGLLLTLYTTDFGKEKMVSLKGLDDKTIEQQVTDLVKSTI